MSDPLADVVAYIGQALPAFIGGGAAGGVLGYWLGPYFEDRTAAKAERRKRQIETLKDMQERVRGIEALRLRLNEDYPWEDQQSEFLASERLTHNVADAQAHVEHIQDESLRQAVATYLSLIFDMDQQARGPALLVVNREIGRAYREL
jgi:hypothetical protein